MSRQPIETRPAGRAIVYILALLIARDAVILRIRRRLAR